MNVANVKRILALAMAASGCLAALLLQAGCSSIFGGGGTTNPLAWVPPTSGPTNAPPAQASASSATQRGLRPGDRVVVTLQPSLNAAGQTVEDIVDDDGMITLPLVGEFRVAGRTPSEVGKAIAQEYVDREIYLDMIVNVVNINNDATAAEEYSVTGEIQRRGRFQLKKGMTLWQAIIAAGDVGEYAGDKVLLTRDGKTTTYRLSAIRKGRVPDPLILNGDIIQIKESSIWDMF
jgi:polysaccharide export outer membrane protein